MKIADVRSFRLRGPSPVSKGFWEERLVRPIDIYPKFREVMDTTTGVESPFEQSFIEILTDEEVTGISGPTNRNLAFFIERTLRPIIIGEDPFAVEKIWDMMYRFQVHGRKGEVMMAISIIDCALWDLIGKAKGEPVVRLLGGPTQQKIPAYASMLGCSLKPEDVVKRCQEQVGKGFPAMKWFFRHGPGSGVTGMEKNVELAKTVRDAVGYDVELMLDCWMSWSIPYTIKMAKKLARYEPAWFEEPLMPDDIDGYAYLSKKIEITVAGGEHEYTRWGVRELLKRHAVGVLQTDVLWAGGITEMKKICALASAEGVPVIPHAGWTEAAQSLIFSQPEHVCPMIEYLVKHSVIQQAFNKEKIHTERGFFKAPSKIGIGFEPQMDKLVTE